MSRELQDLITQLETDREELVAIHDELERQVGRNEIPLHLANKILNRAGGGKPYAEALANKNALLREARDILAAQRRELAIAVSPGAVVIVLGLAFLFSFQGMTGLFTFSEETFYQYEIGQTFTESMNIPLPVTQNLSSLRVTGEVRGVGTATLYLQTASGRYVVATFDSAQPPPSLLTGLFTLDTSVPTALGEVLNETNETNEINETNQSNETVESGLLPLEIPTDPAVAIVPAEQHGVPVSAVSDVSTPPQDEPLTSLAEQGLHNEQTAAGQSMDGVSTESVRDNTSELQQGDSSASETPSPVVLPASPIETPTPVLAEPLTQEWDNECEQTCVLSTQEAPYSLLLTVTGTVTVRIDEVTFGVPPQTSVQRDIDAPAPVQENTDNVNASTNETTPIIEVNETNQTNQTIAVPCTSNADCNSGTCVTSRFAGQTTSGICTQSSATCVDGTTIYNPGDSVQTNVCTRGSQKTDWLVATGEGRFAIRNSNNDTVAVIDRFGMMAIAGTAAFGTIPATAGWLIQDPNNSTVLSIDAAGNVLSAGTLEEQAFPAASNGGDFIVQDKGGMTQAVFTQTGDVLLRGFLLQEVDFP